MKGLHVRFPDGNIWLYLIISMHWTYARGIHSSYKKPVFPWHYRLYQATADGQNQSNLIFVLQELSPTGCSITCKLMKRVLCQTLKCDQAALALPWEPRKSRGSASLHQQRSARQWVKDSAAHGSHMVRSNEESPALKLKTKLTLCASGHRASEGLWCTSSINQCKEFIV